MQPNNPFANLLTMGRSKHRHRSRTHRGTRRGGAVIVELILAMPILFISLLVVAEFGMVMANLKQVALASREGAKIAAETAGLSTTTTGATAAVIRKAVDDRLESAEFGSTATEGVRLDHTVSGGGSAADGTCPSPAGPTLPSGAVRVTVCVKLTKLTPNLLSVFGFDISTRTVEHTTTLDYEL
jgi:Flp pilus assembly protein TadG